MQGQLDWMAAQVLGPGWASAFVPPEPGPEGMRKSTVSAQLGPCGRSKARGCDVLVRLTRARDACMCPTKQKL